MPSIEGRLRNVSRKIDEVWSIRQSETFHDELKSSRNMLADMTTACVWQEFSRCCGQGAGYGNGFEIFWLKLKLMWCWINWIVWVQMIDQDNLQRKQLISWRRVPSSQYNLTCWDVMRVLQNLNVQTWRFWLSVSTCKVSSSSIVSNEFYID